MMEIKHITTYCASSPIVDEAYLDAARQVGRILAQAGIVLVNGAGSTGLMRHGADGCLEAGGRAVGIIPTFMREKGWAHEGMSQIIETPDIHVRQRLLGEMGDAALVLPGGIGTLAELSELIAWRQLGLYMKPIVVLNILGYFDALLRFLDKAIEQHFMAASNASFWRVAETPAEAVDLALSTPLWNSTPGR